MLLEDDFSDIAKKARQGRGLTVEELSRLSGIPRQQLAELESGRRSPAADEIDALARALQLSARALADIAFQRWRPQLGGHLDGVEVVHGDIGGYAVKGYVLFDPSSREAAVVDTGYNPKSMVEVLERQKLTLKAVCLTHGHIDHAGGLDRLLARWPVPVYIGRDDIALLQWRPPADVLTAIEPGAVSPHIAIGSLELRCMVTPGHTPGGLCYRVRAGRQEVCFVGDTLFAGSVGRANPFSLYPQHLDSVRRRLLTLPDDMVLLPGHGPGSTVAEEREHNPFGAETDMTEPGSPGHDDGR